MDLQSPITRVGIQRRRPSPTVLLGTQKEIGEVAGGVPERLGIELR